MSHIIGDGHTFYAVHNMLSATEVTSLNAKRRMEAPKQIEEAMGGFENARALSKPTVGFLVRFVTAMMTSALLGPRIKSRFCYLNDEFIAAEKAKPPHEGVAFVSTNDIITSTFYTSVGADMGTMAVNFRGRVASCSDRDAGNYENTLLTRPEDHASPAMVRKAVTKMQRAADPPTEVPTGWGWGYLKYTFGVTTNWASFNAGFELEKCTQDLHLPIMEFAGATPSRMLSVCIIFKPSRSKLAVILNGGDKLMDKVEATGLTGKPVAVNV